MEQRIIFLDIDGTIAEPGGMAPVPSALEAMERAKARGHKLVLCSGRGYNALRPMLDFGYDAVVANAGAYIICDGQALVDYALSPETVRRTRDLLEEAEILYSIMCRNGFYNSPGYRDLIIQSAHRGSNSELSRWIKFFENEEDVTLANYREEPVQKFIFLARSPGGRVRVLRHGHRPVRNHQWGVDPPHPRQRGGNPGFVRALGASPVRLRGLWRQHERRLHARHGGPRHLHGQRQRRIESPGGRGMPAL